MTDLSTPVLPPNLERLKNQPVLMWAAIVLGGLLVMFFAYTRMISMVGSVPTDLDFSTTLASDGGNYNISYIPQSESIAINQIHSWTLHVDNPNGEPVENAQITVTGDMPQHGHGLPTRPQVTRYLGNGDYLVEGLKFHMPGWWIVEFEVNSGGQTDKVTFNLMLQK